MVDLVSVKHNGLSPFRSRLGLEQAASYLSMVSATSLAAEEGLLIHLCRPVDSRTRLWLTALVCIITSIVLVLSNYKPVLEALKTASSEPPAEPPPSQSQSMYHMSSV